MGTDDPVEPAERVAQRRRLLRVGVIGLGDDSDAFDRDYFRSLSPTEKIAMIAPMFAQQWLMKGGNAESLRLRRDVASLRRRRR
jgi:hypothetical protein